MVGRSQIGKIVREGRLVPDHETDLARLISDNHAIEPIGDPAYPLSNGPGLTRPH